MRNCIYCWSPGGLIHQTDESKVCRDCWDSKDFQVWVDEVVELVEEEMGLSSRLSDSNDRFLRSRMGVSRYYKLKGGVVFRLMLISGQSILNQGYESGAMALVCHNVGIDKVVWPEGTLTPQKAARELIVRFRKELYEMDKADLSEEEQQDIMELMG